jgi:flagellar protein FliO/FliZ
MMKIILGFLFLANIALATTAALSEDQIPLKIDQQIKTADPAANTTKMMVSFVVVSLMLGTAYYFIRKYNATNKSGAKSNMQIKVLSQHFLGPKKSLAIVRVAGESILIGVTENNISMIKALSLMDDELPQVLPKNFNEALTEKTDSMNDVDNMEDDFSFAGLKTTVAQKLKSMRSLQ